MRHIFIGQSEVKIQDVVAVLQQSSEFDDFKQHYSSLLLELKLISGPHESTLTMCLILLQKKSTSVAVTDILDEWARRKGRKAQLHKFINVISKLELHESVNLLHEKFPEVITSNAYSTFIELEGAEMQNSRNKAFELKGIESEIFLKHSKAMGKPRDLRNRFQNKIARSSTDYLGFPQNVKLSEMRAYRNWMLSHFLNILEIVLIILSTITIIYCLPNGWGGIDDLFRETFKPKVGGLSRMGTRSAGPGVINISIGATQIINASSYLEYQKGLLNIPDDALLEVYINLKDTNSWPNDVAFQNAESIKKLVLEGKIETHTILYILEKTTNLMEFELIDSYNGLCHNIDRSANIIGDEANYVESHLIVLDKLHTLKFTNFGNCVSTYKLFLNHIFMSNLSSFYQMNGLVESSNVAVIQGLLRMHEKSLTELHFSNTNWVVSLHDQNFPILSNVREIYIDLIPSSSCPDLGTIITSKFSLMYPNVEIFTSNNGCIMWDHLPRILESSRLHSLTTGVEIPSAMKSANIGFLKNYDYNLHFVEMYLFFPIKTKTDKCTVEGLGLVKEKIKIILDANCSWK